MSLMCLHFSGHDSILTIEGFLNKLPVLPQTLAGKDSGGTEGDKGDLNAQRRELGTEINYIARTWKKL